MYVLEFISGFSVLFHGSTCLFQVTTRKTDNIIKKLIKCKLTPPQEKNNNSNNKPLGTRVIKSEALGLNSKAFMLLTIDYDITESPLAMNQPIQVDQFLYPEGGNS